MAEERVGTCGGCGARYKIPESFTGTKAKCKKCDGGVVDIPPVESVELEPLVEEPVGETQPQAPRAVVRRKARRRREPRPTRDGRVKRILGAGMTWFLGLRRRWKVVVILFLVAPCAILDHESKRGEEWDTCAADGCVADAYRQYDDQAAAYRAGAQAGKWYCTSHLIIVDECVHPSCREGGISLDIPDDCAASVGLRPGDPYCRAHGWPFERVPVARDKEGRRFIDTDSLEAAHANARQCSWFAMDPRPPADLLAQMEAPYQPDSYTAYMCAATAHKGIELVFTGVGWHAENGPVPSSNGVMGLCEAHFEETLLMFRNTWESQKMPCASCSSGHNVGRAVKVVAMDIIQKRRPVKAPAKSVALPACRVCGAPTRTQLRAYSRSNPYPGEQVPLHYEPKTCWMEFSNRAATYGYTGVGDPSLVPGAQ